MTMKAKTAMAERTFANWLLEEIEKRNMSVRAFASEAGVAHTTLNRILNPQNATDYPSLDTLIKVAHYTEVDICTLIGIIAPNETEIDPDVQLIAERIAKLSPAKQEIIDRYLIGLFLKPDEEIE